MPPEPQSVVLPANTVGRFTADELYAAHKADRKKLEEGCKDGAVEVVGIVHLVSFHDDVLGKSLSLDVKALSNVTLPCKLQPKYRTGLTALVGKGQQVKVRGRYDGSSHVVPRLLDCEFVERGKAAAPEQYLVAELLDRFPKVVHEFRKRGVQTIAVTGKVHNIHRDDVTMTADGKHFVTIMRPGASGRSRALKIGEEATVVGNYEFANEMTRTLWLSYGVVVEK